MSGKYSKTGWKKYEFPPDMITQEEGEKTMKLTKHQLQRMLKERIFTKVQVASYTGDAIAEEKWKAWLIKSEAKSIREKLNDEFIEDFIFWLQGRSPYNATEFDRIVYDEEGQPLDREAVTGTPWGNTPLTGVSGVSDFLDQGLERRQRVITYLSKLKLRTPRNLNEAYIYYKYIVREVGIDDKACHEVDSMSEFDSPTGPGGVPWGPIGPSPPLYDGSKYKVNFRMNFDVAKNDPALYIAWLMERAPERTFLSRGLVDGYLTLYPEDAERMDAEIDAGRVSVYGPTGYFPVDEYGAYLFSEELEDRGDEIFKMDYFALSPSDRDIMVATAYTFYVAGAPLFAPGERPEGIPGAYAEAADVAAYREMMGAKKTKNLYKKTEKQMDKIQEKHERVMKMTTAHLDRRRAPTAAEMEFRDALREEKRKVRIYGPRRGRGAAEVAREDLRDAREVDDLLRRGRRTGARYRVPGEPAGARAPAPAEDDDDEMTRFPAGRPGFKFNRRTGFFHRKRGDYADPAGVRGAVEEIAREHGGDGERVVEVIREVAAAPVEDVRAVADVIRAAGPEAIVELDKRMPVDARKYNGLDFLKDRVGVHHRILRYLQMPHNVANPGEHPRFNDERANNLLGVLGLALRDNTHGVDVVKNGLLPIVGDEGIAQDTANKIVDFRAEATNADIATANNAIETLNRIRIFDSNVAGGMMGFPGIDENPQLANRIWGFMDQFNITQNHFMKAMLGQKDGNYGITPQAITAAKRGPEAFQNWARQARQDAHIAMADLAEDFETNPDWTVDRLRGIGGPALDDPTGDRIYQRLTTAYEAIMKDFIGHAGAVDYEILLTAREKKRTKRDTYIKNLHPLGGTNKKVVDREMAVRRAAVPNPAAEIAAPAPVVAAPPAVDPPEPAPVPVPVEPLEPALDAGERAALVAERARLGREGIRAAILQEMETNDILRNRFALAEEWAPAMMNYLNDPNSQASRLMRPDQKQKLVQITEAVGRGRHAPKKAYDKLAGINKGARRRDYADYDLQRRAGAAHTDIRRLSRVNREGMSDAQKRDLDSQIGVAKQNLYLLSLQDKMRGGAMLIRPRDPAPAPAPAPVAPPDPVVRVPEVAPPPEPIAMEVEEPVGAFAPPAVEAAIERVEGAAAELPDLNEDIAMDEEDLEGALDDPIELEIPEEEARDPAAEMVELPADAPRIAEMGGGPARNIVRALAQVFTKTKPEFDKMQDDLMADPEHTVPLSLYLKPDAYRTGLKYEGPWEDEEMVQDQYGIASNINGGAIRVAKALAQNGIDIVPGKKANFRDTPNAEIIKATVTKYAKLELLMKYWGDGNFDAVLPILGEGFSSAPLHTLAGSETNLSQATADVALRALSIFPGDFAAASPEEKQQYRQITGELYDQFTRLQTISALHDKTNMVSYENILGIPPGNRLSLDGLRAVIKEKGLKKLFGNGGALDPDVHTGIEDFKNLEAAQSELAAKAKVNTNMVIPIMVNQSGGVLGINYIQRLAHELSRVPSKYIFPMGLTTRFPLDKYGTVQESEQLFGGPPLQAEGPYGNPDVSGHDYAKYTRRMDQSMTFALLEGFQRAMEALPSGIGQHHVEASGSATNFDKTPTTDQTHNAIGRNVATHFRLREANLQDEFRELEGAEERVAEFKQHLDDLSTDAAIAIYSAIYSLTEAEQYKGGEMTEANAMNIRKAIDAINPRTVEYLDHDPDEEGNVIWADAFSTMLVGAKTLAVRTRAATDPVDIRALQWALDEVFPQQVIREEGGKLIKAPKTQRSTGNAYAVTAQAIESLTRQMRNISGNEAASREKFAEIFGGAELMGIESARAKLPDFIMDTLSGASRSQSPEEAAMRREAIRQYAMARTNVINANQLRRK